MIQTTSLYFLLHGKTSLHSSNYTWLWFTLLQGEKKKSSFSIPLTTCSEVSETPKSILSFVMLLAVLAHWWRHHTFCKRSSCKQDGKLVKMLGLWDLNVESLVKRICKMCLDLTEDTTLPKALTTTVLNIWLMCFC